MIQIDSIWELKVDNVWSVSAQQIADLWEKEKTAEGFAASEEKLLNVIRHAFEVVHYNALDPRDVEKYEKNGEWVLFSHINERKGHVAIRPKQIKNLSDLTTENIHHISVGAVLDLIARNFGGGWDVIPNKVKEIIEEGFDVTTTQLPTSRIHAPGGSIERKQKQGYEVLEIPKGTWTEAIFVRKKVDYELIEAEKLAAAAASEEDTDVVTDEDDTYYSSYAEEAEMKEEPEDGFSIEKEEE